MLIFASDCRITLASSRLCGVHPRGNWLQTISEGGNLQIFCPLTHHRLQVQTAPSGTEESRHCNIREKKYQATHYYRQAWLCCSLFISRLGVLFPWTLSKHIGSSFPFFFISRESAKLSEGKTARKKSYS